MHIQGEKKSCEVEGGGGGGVYGGGEGYCVATVHNDSGIIQHFQLHIFTEFLQDTCMGAAGKN